MASPIMNLRIFTRSTPHTLRAISIVIFPPAFLLMLIHGIAANRVNPAISLIPLFASSAYSALLLNNEKQCGCQHSGLSGTPIHLVCDLLLAGGLLLCLILSWVNIPRGWMDEGLIMLATYCTNFLIVNFLIHSYFVIQQLYESITPGSNFPTSCPQCQYGPFKINTGRKGYAPLLDSEDRQNGYRDYQNDDGEQNQGSAARSDEAGSNAV